MLVVAPARRAALIWALTGLGAAGLAAVPAAASAAATVTAARAAASSARPVPAVPATARFVTRPQSPAVPPGFRPACPVPTWPGQMACMALVPAGRAAVTPDASPVGYDPATLQNAYGLAAAAARPADGETVAIVDAYDDPAAATDVAAYRQNYGLPPCTSASGCLKVVNQYGATSSLPGVDSTGGWELEESVDLEMVSAICPNCNILLVEANSDSISDLATAERYATLHANAVSNSWGSGAEFIGESEFDPEFFRPGVAIAAAAGDDGYGTQFPAVSPYVTAVGGTTLTGASATSTGSQTAWSGTGSGCSSLEPQPAWQAGVVPAGCRNRTVADLSADADPSTGVAVYDTSPPYKGWVGERVGGTSVSTPIVAAAYALADISAGGPGDGLLPGTFPAAYPYQSPGDFTDVTTGSNGTCEPARQYLCHAGTGYDGPTGLGTPDGTSGLSGPSGNAVSVINPGTRVFLPGAPVSLPIQAIDTDSGGLPDYSISGPATLLANSEGVAGVAPARPGVYPVTVTVTDSGDASAQQSVTFSIVVVARLADPHPGYGPVRLDLGGKCLEDAGNSRASGTRVEIGACAGQAAENWAFIPADAPAGAGLVKIHGKCLTVRPGVRLTLQPCTGGSSQRWLYQAGDELANPGSGKCLADPGGSRVNGTQAEIASCDGAADRSWTLPPAPVLAGIAGQCLTDPGDSSRAGTRVEISGCSASAAQKWTMTRGGALTIRGKCLQVAGRSLTDGAPIELARCGSTPAQQWQTGPDGQLLNGNSGRCLADPANSAASPKLAQEDCYSQPGEIWAVS
jgi:hypothetical protein